MDFKAFFTFKWIIDTFRRKQLLFVLALSTNIGLAQSQPTSQGPITFEKKMIASESFESVGVFDVNNDGHLDIVSGAYWYEGPGYLDRHYMGSPKRYGEFWDDFSTIPLDVNGDGLLDVISGGWFGKKLIWRENPGSDKEWAEHIIAETGNIETTKAWDIDGDGNLEIVPNTPNSELVIYKLGEDGNFSAHKIAPKHGHGLGFGDVNGDGRGDFVIHNGWLEAPEKPFEEDWIFHQEFDFGHASIPIIIEDINGDGLADLIVGHAHGYGLDWYEQKAKKSMTAGKESIENTSWIKHEIDPINSQFHAIQWVDIDGDGQKELITGKRYRAHNGRDPGSNDPLGIYYFQWNGASFVKQFVSYGPFGVGKGTGISFCVNDLSGSGRQDIIVAGKDGLCIFYNKGTDP